MDDRHHFSGRSKGTRYRTRVNVQCPNHPEGHKMMCYSQGTDDAWWMADLFAALVAKGGFHCALQFERSDDGDVWEAVLPHEAVPDEPAF